MLADGGKKIAGGTAKTLFSAGGMLNQAKGAAEGAKEAGGDKGKQYNAFMHSIGSSAKQAMRTRGSNLARSLLGGGSGGSGGGGGLNPHDNLQQHLSRRDANGNRESIKDYMQGRREAGKDVGKYHLFNDRFANASKPRDKKE